MTNLKLTHCLRDNGISKGDNKPSDGWFEAFTCNQVMHFHIHALTVLAKCGQLKCVLMVAIVSSVLVCALLAAKSWNLRVYGLQSISQYKGNFPLSSCYVRHSIVDRSLPTETESYLE
jgi:hypothetical protein